MFGLEIIMVTFLIVCELLFFLDNYYNNISYNIIIFTLCELYVYTMLLKLFTNKETYLHCCCKIFIHIWVIGLVNIMPRFFVALYSTFIRNMQNFVSTIFIEYFKKHL